MHFIPHHAKGGNDQRAAARGQPEAGSFPPFAALLLWCSSRVFA